MQIPTFSPLHSGQATAMYIFTFSGALASDFQSPPFGASHCNSLLMTLTPNATSTFQSPPFGASHCNWMHWRRETRYTRTFSPLHSGQATAMRAAYPTPQPQIVFQSPPFGASHCNDTAA